MASAPAQTVNRSQDDGPFPAPDFSHTSRLFIFGTADNQQLKVGDDEGAFKAAFPWSVTKSHSLDPEPPQGADADHWIARGWELDNESKGFGALYYDNHLAVVMGQVNGVEETDVSNEVSRYTLKFGPADDQLDGKHVRYWFWKGDPSALMVCAFSKGQKEINLTTALGDAGVMARLHMTYPTAEDDFKSVESLYGPVGQGANVPGNTQ